ncbi:MAG: hypothetical protein QOJ26_10 [Thermoplasmata archaeon]|jgi:hypothetical protein|nr:hypothetical protein [Thermoplasmata archaeon]MEA3165166.1 hypothetical protein [Thermoplasmata archaeon]
MRDDLLEEGTAARLAAARAGQDVSRRLRVASLEAGQVGVLEAQVRAVAPSRPYARKRGGEGLLQRVTLADDTGEVDLVLWDDELRHAATAGAFQPGAFLRLRGAAVKAGHRGGVELGLGSAVVEPMAAPRAEGPVVLVGVPRAFGEVRPVGAPPALRFSMDATLETLDGLVQVAAWDQAVKQLRALGLGVRVRLEGCTPNPFLQGWWTCPGPVGPASAPSGMDK